MRNGSLMVTGDGYEEVWRESMRRIFDNPDYRVESRSGIMREVMNLSFRVSNPYDRMVWNEHRDANYEFAMKMFLWIFTGSNDAAYLTGINPNAANYLDKGADAKPTAQFVTAYGPRIAEQMPDLIGELNVNEGTRRASIMILDGGDRIYRYDPESKIEYPCCQSINFHIRNGRLDCSVVMRSANMFTTNVYDVYVFTLIQEFVLKTLNQWRLVDELCRPPLKMGSYTQHNISAHLFESDKDRIMAALRNNANITLRRHDAKN